MATPSVWVDAVVSKAAHLLPHLPNPLGSSTDELLKESITSILDLSQYQFAAVISGLSSLLETLNKEYPPTVADSAVVQSYCIVLDCLASCLSQRGLISFEDGDLPSLQHFFQRITQLCLLSGPETEKISLSACSVLYQLSGLHFHSIFNKIILRVTSVNRISNLGDSSTSSSTYSSEQCVIQLIPHLNLNAPRLQQILQVIVTSFKDLKKHKQMFSSIPEILHKSIWNFMREYPAEFNEVLKSAYPSLARSAEKLFTQCDEYADTVKKKGQIWPLQNTLLLLCPHVMESMAFGDGDKGSPRHKTTTQKNFLSAVMKGFGNKLLCEAAVICATDMFTACTYVTDRSSQIFRYFVTQMQGNLQNLLFCPSSPFLHQSSSVAAAMPTFSDMDMMVRCLVAQFRLNHRNTHTFNICINFDSPPSFKLAFLQALHVLLKEKQTMSWWPDSAAVYVYATQLRAIFQTVIPIVRKCDMSSPTLSNDIRCFLQSPTAATNMLNTKSKTEKKQLVELIVHYQLIQWIINLYSMDPILAFTFKNQSGAAGESLHLMTGLVSLVQHQTPPHLFLNTSEVLLKLHEPQNIELWDPINTMIAFWDISCQVTYSITQKLFSRKTTEPLQLLKWLREILYYRTSFLRKHSQEAFLGGVNSKVSQQLYTMLETVLLLFLRNIDIEAVQVAMSSFKFLVTEADLVSSPTEPVPYAANLRPYKQLEAISKTLLIGRAAQQKRIRLILKDLVHTPGSALAWEDTYSSWRVSRSLLVAYHNPHSEAQPPDVIKGAESFPHTLMRRVNNSFIAKPSARMQETLTEENLQATLLNWTNMTGFLCSLAGVSTKSFQNYPLGIFPSSSSLPGGESVSPPNSVGTIPRGIDSTDCLQTSSTSSTSSSSKVKRSSSYHGNRPKSVSIHAPQARLANQESVRFSSSGESIASAEDPLRSSSGSVPPSASSSQTEGFIADMIHLLSCDNEAVGVNIRETVKEFVSGELSPVIYPYLFHALQEELERIVDTLHLDVTETNTVFVDQVVSIIQRIMDSKTEGGFDNLVHVKVDQVLLALLKYVYNLESRDERSLTMKIKLCGLLQTVVQHSRELSFHNEIQFRNSLVECLTQWVSGKLAGEHATHEETLRSELDLNAMKAVGVVLSGLPLQPKDIGNDIYEEKEKLFLKYFNTFLNLVHSMNSVETSKLGQLRRATITRQVSALREATILAMSNMLTSNIDSGLTHAISLGYHRDLKTRTSFIEVLTSILKQGAEFNSLADTALADRYNQLLELVTVETEDGEHPIMVALINSVPFDNLDELAEVLVVLFDYKNKLPSFLMQILLTEVDALESGKLDTLFQGNTMACKVLSVAFKTFGLYYLQSVLRPLILNLMKTRDCDYEVDPMRMQDRSKLECNQSHLLEVVKSFYDTILTSLPSLPLQLRTVCHILYQVVVGRLDEEGLDTVNSAIFLRFINPAIVSPSSYNLVHGEIPSNARRALTLISKVLQNLANHVLFKKEAHMKVFNEFLADNFEKSRDLACSMASMGPYLDGEAIEYIAFLKEAYKYRLHSLLWNNQDRVASYAASTRASITVRPLFHQLNTLLAQLGAPNTPKKRTVSLATRTALVSSQLEEFIDNMSSECDEKTLRKIKAKEFFYQCGCSKAGNPLFYIIMRKFRGDQIHVSYQLLYHMMVLLKGHTERSFELIIDLTQTTQHNETDSRYLNERKLEPKDVPGTFLNLAFLNLGSSEPRLRVAAYKLLCAVKDAFKLQIDYALDDSHELCIPHTCSQFVLDISQQLAVKEAHLTLEFLSEVVAGFQRYSTACKQLCLAYLSPWMPNLSHYVVRNETSRAEQEKLVKIFDLLVSLSISEVEMYPLIQEHVWCRISSEPDLLRSVLDSFIRACISDGPASLKVKVLSDTAVTLSRHHGGIVSQTVVKRMLKTLMATNEKPTNTLEQHYLWVELAVLSQFLVNLSFNNYLNVLSHLPDIFYISIIMIGHGTITTKAAIHGLIINTLHSLLTIQHIAQNADVMKVVTLKLVEFSQPSIYMQFGLHNAKTAIEGVHIHNPQAHHQSMQSSDYTKDPLSTNTILAVVEHLHDVMGSIRSVYPDVEWHLRWQKLARRSAFSPNPSLQTRSFLMLGVISSHASSHVITRTLKVMEESVMQHQENISLLESIVTCLTRLIPLLDHTSKLTHHLFWVAVGVLQLEDPTLYAATLGLIEGCIKAFTNYGELAENSLADVVHPARESLLWQLNHLDREVGISFDSDFNFALSTLLFKGFSHSLSTVRTRTQELLTTLFFLHSPHDSDTFQVNEHNLAYLTALFPESDIVRQQLQDNRTRLMTYVPSRSGSEGHVSTQKPFSYTPLLNTHIIATHKSQILFLHLLASALLQTQSQNRVQLLYEFLADASNVFVDIFPLIQLYLTPHLSETLRTSENSDIIKAVQKLIRNAVVTASTSSLIKPSYIADVGFGGVTEFFRPFPKNASLEHTQRAAFYQRYLEALIQEISPADGMDRMPSASSLSSVTDLSDTLLSTASAGGGGKRSRSRSSSKHSTRENTPEIENILEEVEDDIGEIPPDGSAV